MEKIDWQEITEELGEDRWRDDWINLPRQSRLLLSKFVQEERFLSRDAQQIYYGPDSQGELYNASKIAHSALINPKSLNPAFGANKSLGSPGLDHSGHDNALVSGAFLEITPYKFLGIGFSKSEAFSSSAFSVIVSGIATVQVVLYVYKTPMTSLPGNVGFSKRVLVHMPDYQGNKLGYDFAVQTSMTEAMFNNWTVQIGTSSTAFYQSSLVAIRTATVGVTGYLQMIAPTWHDINGNSVSV